jgi:vitamin B12 transporter
VVAQSQALPPGSEDASVPLPPMDASTVPEQSPGEAAAPQQPAEDAASSAQLSEDAVVPALLAEDAAVLTQPSEDAALLAPSAAPSSAVADHARANDGRAERALEVTVRGTPSDAQRLTKSAEAVTVVSTRRAKQQAADLGEVLARTQGIAIRRDGGLGSNTRFSLNGLWDEQIRFFLDGVPLDVAGYPFGVANVPVNLIERVEVYRGVVPVRFGADALGGALNLATDSRYDNHLSGSYQVGSFGTHRATLAGRYRHQPSGIVVGAHAFADKADNDYRVDVKVDDAEMNVRRFHDGYRAFGGAIEVGVVDRAWAKRLLLRLYATTYDKELQHNIVMAVPYGEVKSGETVYGATARYDVDLHQTLKLESVVSYARRAIDYVDKAAWIYDWYGDRTPRRRPGELRSDATDQTIWQSTGFARVVLSWELAPQQFLRASVTPTLVSRSGNERIQAPNERDPLTAQQDLFTFVSGLEYELNLLEERISNIVFVKDYVYRSKTEELLPGNLFRRADRNEHKQGVGDALRINVVPWLALKASYEYATRLPGASEVFGNGVFVGPNLALKPEVSHNANLGPRVELRLPALGHLTLDVNAFLRQSENLIVLLGEEPAFSFQNVYKARGWGLENAFAWTSPGRWVALDGALTWQDLRNVSESGTFGRHAGQPVPNRPWLFASWGARLRFGSLPGADDALEPYYIGRYVNAFRRDWDSTSQRVPVQVMHNLGLTYGISWAQLRTSTTFEVSNVSDERLYDNFRVQKPGRAYYLKITAEL